MKKQVYFSWHFVEHELLFCISVHERKHSDDHTLQKLEVGLSFAPAITLSNMDAEILF